MVLTVVIVMIRMVWHSDGGDECSGCGDDGSDCGHFIGILGGCGEWL